MKPIAVKAKIFVAVILIVFGCAGSHSECGLNRENGKDPIVGLWSTQNDDLQVEFLPNGGVASGVGPGVGLNDTANSRWEYLPKCELNLIVLDDREIYYSTEPGSPAKKSWRGKVVKDGRVYSYFPDCTRPSFKKKIYVKDELLVVDHGNYQDKYKRLK